MMTPEAYDQLIEAIVGDNLEINEDNAEMVKEAWAESLIFDTAFEEIGLSDLPDPEGDALNSQICENWLAKAYGPKFGSEAETRRRLQIAREEILKDAREEGLL